MNNNTKPAPAGPSLSKNSSSAIFIVIILAVAGAMVFAGYHYGSKYMGGESESQVARVMAPASTSSGRIASDEERTQAFTALFGTVAEVGQIVAPMAMGMVGGGMPPGFPGAETGQDMAGMMDGAVPDAGDSGTENSFAANQAPLDDSMGIEQDPADSSGTEEGVTVTQLRNDSEYLALGDPALGVGVNVVKEIVSEGPEGRVSLTENYNALAQEEFKVSKLTKAELARLSQLNINLDFNKGETVSGEDYQTLQKLVSLIYYGKRLGKGPSIAVLVESLHPSIRQAIAQRSDLAVEVSGQPETTQAAVVQPQQAQPSDDMVDSLKLVEEEAKKSLNSVIPDDAATEARFNEGRSAANSGSFAKALRLWLPLAESGHAPSRTALGRLYARGDGVKKDLAEARHWFELAAGQGDSKAQLNIGKMYLRGDGGPRDTGKARQYLAMAAQAGDGEASSLLKSFEKGTR